MISEFLQIYEQAGKTYGDQKLPYSVHISSALNFYSKFKHLLKPSEYLPIAYAIYMHDMMEDCGLSYNDVRRLGESYSPNMGDFIADIVYNVTDELGKTREEKHLRTYPKTASCYHSIFVKMCDRLANTVWSKYMDTNSNMFIKYKLEYPTFKEHLYCEELKPMFDLLEGFYNTEIKK